MTNIILCGANGRMGKFITDAVSKREDARIVAGVDLNTESSAGFPVFATIGEVTVPADVIVDFSHPALLDSILDYVKKKNIPAVLATTGYSAEATAKIRKAAEISPIFFTFNMSLGVNLLVSLSKRAAEVLGDAFDIEIVEKHHNQKLDAPSGTAVMLADAINEVYGNEMSYEFDRHSKREKRPKKQIGIHSIRGGNIVGEHDVIFAGHDEVITLSHHASSREVFALGAVKAALFMKGKDAGLYNMNDMLEF